MVPDQIVSTVGFTMMIVCLIALAVSFTGFAMSLGRKSGGTDESSAPTETDGTDGCWERATTSVERQNTTWSKES